MSDPDEVVPLLFEASEEALLEELGRRCSALVVISLSAAPSGEDEESTAVYFRGGRVLALGLLDACREHILRGA